MKTSILAYFMQCPALFLDYNTVILHNGKLLLILWYVFFPENKDSAVPDCRLRRSGSRDGLVKFI